MLCAEISLTLDSIGAVESVKAASDIYAPVGGVVEEINETLNDQPNLLNKKPEGDGECSCCAGGSWTKGVRGRWMWEVEEAWDSREKVKPEVEQLAARHGRVMGGWGTEYCLSDPTPKNTGATPPAEEAAGKGVSQRKRGRSRNCPRWTFVSPATISPDPRPHTSPHLALPSTLKSNNAEITSAALTSRLARQDPTLQPGGVRVAAQRRGVQGPLRGPVRGPLGGISTSKEMSVQVSLLRIVMHQDVQRDF